MGFLLRKRHVTSLHASCVEICGQGVAFSGDAGFGKSTTAAALALRGYPVLSEDIVPLKLQEEDIRAVPGYPRICLWPDSVANLLKLSAGVATTYGCLGKTIFGARWKSRKVLW